MKNTKPARLTDVEARARFDEIAKEAAIKRRLATPVTILDHFSAEQRVQIRRLAIAGDFEGRTEAAAANETIAWLAESALYVFGLDPIARRAFDRVSEAAGTDKVDDGVINSCINEMREASEAWTQRRRDNECEAALKGRAA